MTRGASGRAAEAPGTPIDSATPAPPPSITIAAVGDLMLARRVTTLKGAGGTAYPFERVRPLFEGVGLVIANMEGTFTGRGVAMEKLYTFRTPPSLSRVLRDVGFDAVPLANNHAFDFGVRGRDDHANPRGTAAGTVSSGDDRCNRGPAPPGDGRCGRRDPRPPRRAWARWGPGSSLKGSLTGGAAGALSGGPDPVRYVS